MNFVQPLLLWGLLGVSIPIIIHLLNRRRFRTVKWGAMQFLLKATRESRGQKRLKHILILLMRALAIAALVFAVSRPRVGGFLGWGGGRVDTIILVLDRSASMERTEPGARQSKRESVLERVARAMDDIGEARLVLIDSATGSAHEVPSPEVLPGLSLTAPTDASADVPGMLAAALDYLRQAKPARSEIWIASDLQRHDWAPADSRWDAFRASLEELGLDTRLRVLALNDRPGNDFAIRVHSARRDNADLVLDLEITRENDEGPVEKPVTISHLGARSAGLVELAGQSLRFRKRLPLEGRQAGGHGWVSLPDLSNQRNNVAYYAYGPETAVYAYLVADPSTSPESLASIEKAVAPGAAKQELTTLDPQRAHLIDFDLASLVVWKAPIPSPGPVASQLLAFVRSGGVCVFLPPEADGAATFGGIGWDSVEQAEEGRYFIVKEWSRADGPLRDAADGTSLPVQRLRAILRRPINGDPAVLARWDDGTPFLARRIIDRGTILFLATLPDYAWSNLEQTALHLVVLQRAFEAGSRRLGAGFFGVAGEPSALPRGNEVLTRLDTYETAPAANPGYLAGAYRFGDRTVAVNRPPDEDSLEFLAPSDLQVVLEGTGYTLLEEAGASTDSFWREIWRTFLMAMLVFLIVEAVLCLQRRRPAPVSEPAAQPAT